jgi:hypothetical protein
VLLLAGLTVIAFALRLPSFTDSLWGDELSTNFVVHGFGAGSPITIIKGDQEGTPPLFFLVVWLFRGIDGAEGLRIVSLVAGLASVPLVYLLGIRTVGTPAAIVAAAVLALSPFQIFYGTEARAYALTMTLCLVAALTLLAALDSGRARWWIVYGLSVAAAAYTHYTSAFVLVGLLGWAFVTHPKARRPILLSNLGAAVLYVPWIPELLDDRHEPAAKVIQAVHPLTLTHAWNDLGQWAFGNPNIPAQVLPGRLAIWLLLAAVVLGAIGLVVRLRREGRSRWRPSTGLLLVLVLALATPVGEAIQGIVTDSVFIPRNLISSSAGLALLAGALVTAPPPPIRVAAVGALLAGFAIGGVKMLDSGNQRPDYDGLAGFLKSTAAPGDPIVDLPQPTPGPQTAMEAALAPHGQARPPADRPVIEIGFPTLQTRLDAVRHGGTYTAFLHVPPPQQLAAKAAADAHANDGKIYLVGPDVPLPRLRALGGTVGDFLAALPPGYHEVERRSYPGLFIFPIGLHVLQRAPAP